MKPLWRRWARRLGGLRMPGWLARLFDPDQPVEEVTARLSARVVFSIVSTPPAPIEVPLTIEPRVAQTLLENVAAARMRFESGDDFAPLVPMVESGVTVRSLITEVMPGSARGLLVSMSSGQDS